MKIFVRKLFYFLSLSAMITLIVVFIMYKSFNHREAFKLDKRITNVIMGHSHSQCALDDSLITNFKNFSESGESYFYTYIKLKKVLQYNPQIKNVFIEYSNNQIDKIMDEWTWGDNYLLSKFPEYSTFMNLPDLSILFLHNPRSFSEALSISFKQDVFNFIKPRKEREPNLGGYLYLKRFKTDSLINALKNGKSITPTFAISRVNIRYLKKIVSVCSLARVHIYFIRSPLNSFYPELRNEVAYKEILKNQFSNIDYLDFKDFPLSNDEFGDLEHLNYKGARVFSRYFNQLINDGLLTKKDKQSVIENSMSLNRQALSPQKAF